MFERKGIGKEIKEDEMSTHFYKTEIRRRSANCLKHTLSAFREGLHDRWACWPAELLSEASDTLEIQNDMVKDP